ncbi:aromatic-amino-acid transaminase [Caminicella sporogenes DSM 14501]|uniref:Aromatic-amino-acid transaminase n=1 Tax=Caminicella sporogenes DSM 14501 TaxID=1121266 RepID=A0A1M6QVD5_9FIRM|nr:aminotransferase class I/II-fold pyridoxal phosphate-dependent enzyme [Caminicella sporogenes]RKD20899.1 aminotransferase [Caminicella sporogenes]SHK24048.1 aromatic-amino-acid transaminase [Caminicella sporogenes DSM 14501]
MSENFSMVAPHSKRPVNEDKIFAASRQAKEAIEKYGFENVINSTVGALLDDNGKLLVLPTVIKVLKNLPPEEIAAYAPIAGLPEYLETVKTAAFRECMPEGYIEAIATPGGSGAIRHTIWNYSEMGDYILTSDWYWGPYKTIAEEHGRKITTYTFFDENKNFNIKSFREKLNQLLKIQDRVVILLNSPAHNPTGFSLEISEWEEVINILKNFAKNKDKKIILFSDIAYIDFAGEKNKSRQFMKLFGNLPENILTIVSFSMSKGYTLYGMRSGAMICITSNKSIAEEFKNVGQFSNRGVWSNGTRSAMKILAEIFKNSELLSKVETERNVLKKMLNERAQSFVNEAKKIGLDICPYKSGFFITIPCNNPELVSEKLKKDNIFVVPLQKGIRFAVCSVSKEKCLKAPLKLLNAIKNI